ncbi:MAG: hypothetical protein KAI47_21035 [Deltaproteobacteria bacterium]|nr:hypothetical protein [Deltaproteobacteria bacterium]
MADAVFDHRDDGTVRFAVVLAPSDDELSAICTQVATRVVKLIDGDDHAFFGSRRVRLSNSAHLPRRASGRPKTSSLQKKPSKGIRSMDSAGMVREDETA